MHIGCQDQSKKTIYYMKDGENKIEIEQCEQEKDLGVIFDSTLNFDRHINSAIRKANKMIGLIKRSFKYLNKSTFL